MKNSIEEDIKNAEHFIKSIKTDKEYKEENGWHGYYNKEIVELARILENILSDYKRVIKIKEVLLKENKELKEKENKIYKEVQESLAFEKFLIVKERKPDLFNQGRFYISQIIYDILKDVQNPEGIHKENKCIQYIDYISVQRVKDKIEKLNKKEKEELKRMKGQDRYFVKQIYQTKRIILQELIEEREEK